MAAPAQPRYVVVTGGVVSSLGKGIAAASLGTLLHARGLRVRLTKADPYLNLDPGTQSPAEHGELFVSADGAEADLDGGHYERFTDVPITRASSFSSGQVYEEVLRRERAGEYLGKTVQVIPHVTDEIKRRLTYAQDVDVHIIEIGGTVGDIESQPFLEALRQLRRQVGSRNICFIHCTPLVWMQAAGELKTKPTQHSVAWLRQLGITPDVLLLRAEQPVPAELREKIAAFCDVDNDAVISAPDARSIYEVPLLLNAQGLDELVCERLNLTTSEPDLTDWRSVCEKLIGASVPVKVAIVGKYTHHQDAYISVAEALKHAAARHHRYLQAVWVDAEQLTDTSAPAILADADAVLVPGGFGERGLEGKVAAARYAREHKVPYLGICLGMQVAVIEFARHVCGIRNATSREFAPSGRNCVIDLSAEQRGVKRKGGTQRLGEQQALLEEGSLAHELYGSVHASERHRHRYEVNERYVPKLQQHGLVVSARHPDRGLVEFIELPRGTHPYFIATQAHPEFKSRPTRPHPLFAGLIAAALRPTRAR